MRVMRTFVSHVKSQQARRGQDLTRTVFRTQNDGKKGEICSSQEWDGISSSGIRSTLRTAAASVQPAGPVDANRACDENNSTPALYGHDAGQHTADAGLTALGSPWGSRLTGVWPTVLSACSPRASPLPIESVPLSQQNSPTQPEEGVG